MPSQQGNVVFALSQRRYAPGQDIQPIIEVVAETPSLELNREFPIRGRDDSHIDFTRRIVADAFVLALLKHAQEFWLHFERQVSDLIEKDRAPVSELKSPRPVAQSAGEGTSYVTEELALEHVAGDGAAIPFDEWLIRAGAPMMDLSSHKLLASSGFAHNE